MPGGSEGATMFDPRDSATMSLAKMQAHLSAAEAALADGNPTDPRAACQQALVELQRASAAHDRLVGEISHDLRNRFTLITGQAQLIERSLAKGTLAPDRIQRAVGQINRAVAEANEFIRTLSGS